MDTHIHESSYRHHSFTRSRTGGAVDLQQTVMHVPVVASSAALSQWCGVSRAAGCIFVDGWSGRSDPGEAAGTLQAVKQVLRSHLRGPAWTYTGIGEEVITVTR